MKNAYLDASSAILLHKAGLFDELLTTYRISMVDTVYRELSCDGYPGARVFAERKEEGRLVVCHPPAPGEQLASFPDIAALHPGERDTLRCYVPGPESFIIIDDGTAARVCQQAKIPFINALLFPKILLFCNQLSQNDCIQKTKKLITIGRYGPAIIAFAEECTRDDLAGFLP